MNYLTHKSIQEIHLHSKKLTGEFHLRLFLSNFLCFTAEFHSLFSASSFSPTISADRHRRFRRYLSLSFRRSAVAPARRNEPIFLLISAADSKLIGDIADMTKSCVISRMSEQSRNFVNLHDFLKTKRGIVKYAKKTLPDNNWNDSVKHYDGRFANLTVEESHGSCWIGDRLLRKTGSGLVFLAKNRTPTNPNSDLPTEIVVKSCFMELSSSLQHEKEVLSDLAPCTNVVRCYGDEITTTKSGEKIYNVLFEYCSGSSLRDHIIKSGLNGLPEYEVRKYTRDIVHGLYHMHCNARYIHGDIKPRNILLLPSACAADKGSLIAKMTSFGLAKKLTPEVLCDQEMSGSGPYISPELARDGYLDWPADIWALGCVVLEMLTGKPAWSFENANKYMLDCYNNQLLPEISKEISSAGRDFIKRCLIRSPYKRRPIWLLIKHPFVCF